MISRLVMSKLYTFYTRCQTRMGLSLVLADQRPIYQRWAGDLAVGEAADG
jgi:hypothetical protein